jgi:CBS domain-containing protein
MGLLRLSQMPPMVAPQVSVIDAVHVMIEHEVGAIAVTLGKKLVGVFTERDLMKRVVAQGKDPHTTTIGEVMTRNVYAVHDETRLEEATALMRANHFRHLPIVNGQGEVLGMVALRFVLYDIMDDLDAKVNDLERYLMEDSPGG